LVNQDDLVFLTEIVTDTFLVTTGRGDGPDGCDAVLIRFARRRIETVSDPAIYLVDVLGSVHGPVLEDIFFAVLRRIHRLVVHDGLLAVLGLGFEKPGIAELDLCGATRIFFDM
jgi:hypothetical protein